MEFFARQLKLAEATSGITFQAYERSTISIQNADGK